ncbi:MAG: radical SAM peptide maturase, CXXX-repeat target family [Clostridia bacterium]
MMRYESYQDKVARLFGRMPISASVQVTEDCNLNCSYCYQKNKSEKTMTFEIAKRFIDNLLDFKNGFEKYFNKKDCGGFILDFIGGEPFLAIELIDQISEYVIYKMIENNNPLLPFTRFSISTNGTLYFDKKVQAYLKKYKDFLALSVSVDGDKALHDSCRKFPNGDGSYDMAIAAAKDYRAKGNSLGSKMTLCPQNVDKVANAVISLIENGYDEIHLNCVYEKGWELKDATTLYFELKKLADYLLDNSKDVEISMFNTDFYKPKLESDNENWCGGNGRMIAVDPNGDIFPCLRYMKTSLGNLRKPLRIGDVYNGILQTEKENKIDKCLKCITRRSQSTDECFNCPIASGCSWCTAYNYQESGDPNRRLTYICDTHKAISLANAYYFNKRGTPFKIYLQPDEAVRIVGEAEYEMLKELEKSGK